MNYPLDLTSPVRHVATEMERADHALSISELVATYTHPNPSDVTRVKRAEKLETDKEALAWIIEQALDAIKRYVDNGDGVYRLNVPFEKVKYQKRPIHRIEPRGRFEDSFDPMRGKFSENIRDLSVAREKPGGMDDELRESLEHWGWRKEHPALRDRVTGKVLMGNRRVRLAEELGIEPVFQDVDLGSGDEADAERFIIAITSNIGRKPLNDTDRNRLAEYLYGRKKWSMADVAKALKVNVSTISRNLSPEVLHDAKPKSRGGRPRTKLTAAQEEQAWKMFAEGKSRKDVSKALSVGEHSAQLSQQRYNATVREQAKAAKAEARPEAKVEEPAKAAAAEQEEEAERCQCCGRPF